MNGTATRQPTKPMFDLVRILLVELGELDEQTANTWRTELNLARERGQFDFAACQDAIADLKQAKRELRRKHNVVTGKLTLPDVPEGRYAVEVDGVLKFYSVDVSDNGFVKAFVWASDEQHELPFKAMVAVLDLIVAVTPLEASKAFGRAIGKCGKCHRTLTDPNSRAAGIGPVCAGRL